MSRIKGEVVKKKNDRFESKARGATESFKFNMTGRFFFDVLTAIKIEHKLRSYTLNAVSAKFLGDQKRTCITLSSLLYSKEQMTIGDALPFTA